MKSERITKYLEERIAANDFPSAVYLVAEEGSPVFSGAVGSAVVDPEHIPAAVGTIYDLASLTKVLVTGLLASILIESGELSLDDRASDLLFDFGAADKVELSVVELLTHTSRLPAWRPLYLLTDDPDDVLVEIDKLALGNEPAEVIYSDLNFIVLGKIIERITGKRLDVAASDMIFKPLGLENTYFCPPPADRQRIAASERGNMFELQTCVEQGYSASDLNKSRRFRTEMIWGEVHDGNSYFMGGISGHAGLFANAADILSIATQFLANRTELLSPGSCRLFHTNFTKGSNEDRSIAFQLASTKDSTAGTGVSRGSFGHLGFTGTSLWIDPVMDRIFILLTNRTHARKLPFANINAVRRQFHELAVDELSRNS